MPAASRASFISISWVAVHDLLARGHNSGGEFLRLRNGHIENMVSKPLRGLLSDAGQARELGGQPDDGFNGEHMLQAEPQPAGDLADLVLNGLGCGAKRLVDR